MNFELTPETKPAAQDAKQNTAASAVSPASIPDPRPNAPVADAPLAADTASATSNPIAAEAQASPGPAPHIPAIEREEAREQEDFEPAEAHGDEDEPVSATGPVPVHAEVPDVIEATIDFSEVELADEFAEPPVAVTPGGVLPMEPSPVEGRLRKAPLRVPDELEEAGGFTLFGRRIKSLLYTTDVAVIRNSNADAIFAVYPFTAQPAITQALLTASESPVFVGVGGGTTTGKRAVQLAAVSEMQGAAGVVVNSPAPP